MGIRIYNILRNYFVGLVAAILETIVFLFLGATSGDISEGWFYIFVAVTIVNVYQQVTWRE